MYPFSRTLVAALMCAAFISSCSRPVAYFQKTPREHYTSPHRETVATVAPAEVAQPSITTTEAPATPAPEATKAAQVASAKQVMSQIDAYVRNDSKLASNKKLTRRLERANQMLAAANEKTVVSTNGASAKKLSLMERSVLKKLDKKIKHTLAPDDTNALNRNVRNGIIVGAIGLILSLFGGIIGIIGLILLVVGVVLILLGVLE